MATALDSGRPGPAGVAWRLRGWTQTRNPLWALDYDGTLVGFQTDPTKVELGERSIKLLEELAQRGDCAVVSGRALRDLEAKFPERNLHLIGNHGAEVRRRDGSRWQWESLAWRRWRAARIHDLQALVEKHEGRLEDKYFSLTVHFRGSPRREWWLAEGGQCLKSFVDGFATLMEGGQAWNILGLGAPHKGQAVQTLCLQTGHDSVIYFGDERTDEDVFAQGGLDLFGVKVGPGSSAAEHRLESPEDVIETLVLALADV